MLHYKYDEVREDLWSQPEDRAKRKQASCLDFSRYMKFNRWKQLKTDILIPFSDPSAGWVIDPLIAAFNKLMATMVRGGTVKVNDETMSAFRPRAS